MTDQGQSPARKLPMDSSGDGGASVPSPEGRLTAYLLPGQLHVASDPTAVTTVLGSCVAVCLCDRAARVGGMNHYLLPTHVERERSPRFGSVAIEELVSGVLARGARKSRLEAKVFGGASVTGAPQPGRRLLGDENVRLALRLLESLAIPVVGGDVGGTRGRKLVFHTDDGNAWMRLL